MLYIVGTFLLLLQGILSASIEPTTTIWPKAQRSLRLPNTTYPLSYELHLTTNIHLKDLKFTGNVSIDVEIKEATNEIVLHAKNLSDYQITVREIDSNELLDDLTHTYEPHGNFLIIHPHENYQAFEVGKTYRVQIFYTGIMQDRTVGLYWMSYEDANNNRTVYLAATQSEPTYARLLFPCYDEPAFKSNFTIHLTHGSHFMAISNMQVKNLQQNGAMTTTSFYATPRMSTYLVAFVISDYEYISDEYRGTIQRIFTPPGSIEKGQRALKNAMRTVAAFEDYFGMHYPLDKLDHIALKKNYGAAMENWGLITYKEESLISTKNDDVHKKLKDKLTQNHEIAHQWFGNLVSPAWWTYAWMNEGFATYFSYVISDLLYPEEKIMDFFLTDIAERAYSYNSISVRPMTYYVEKESEIMSIFDIITYQRAACVIKMFHHAFNQKTFVRGISEFLRKFQYTVANELQLFEVIQMFVQQDKRFQDQPWVNSVQDIMLSWTHSEWIPILTVRRNYEDNTITLKQRSKDRTSYENWWIPLNFATPESHDFESTHAEYFMPPLTEVTIPLPDLSLHLSSDDWLIVNKQQTGFYHVLYDDVNLRAIARQLQHNHTVIHPMNRASIFQDLTPLIEHNEIESVDVIFELLKYLELEEDLGPWTLVADTIHFIERNLFGTASHDLFKQFVRRLISPTFQRLFHNDSVTQNNLTNSYCLARQKIVEMACMADLPECLEYTHRLAHNYIFQQKNFDMEVDYYAMYDTVLCVGVKYLTDDEFDKVIELLSKSERNSLYYDDLIYSLRCTQDLHHLRQYLNVLLGENSTHLIMNDSDSMMYLLYLYKSNMVARPVVWHFFERNYKTLCRSPFFTENFNRIAEYIPYKERPYFNKLRDGIATECNTKTLISPESDRVGKKMRNSELFLQKFEQQIHDWLLKEQPKVTYAASLSPKNSAARATSFFYWANSLFTEFLDINL